VADNLEPRAESPFQGPDQPSRALIDKCVHCGFCLPTCPTYVLWGEEMDSPRGRIYLMKAGLEGRAEMNASFVQHFDRCLGCLACVTACPSGVQYAPLIEKSRVQIERRYQRPEQDRLFRQLLMSLIPYPSRLRVLMAPLLVLNPFMGRSGGLSPRIASIFPARLKALLSVTPRVSLSGLVGRVAARTEAIGAERLKVALLEGCVQRIAFANVNEATVRVLAAEGCRVEAPRAQGCCGALPLHAGYIEQARELARHNIEVFEAAGVDLIVTNAAGCGSAMKEYGELFEGDSQWAERGKAFSRKVRDVSQLLFELGEPRAVRRPIRGRVVYHDACHLAHGQGIRSEPRALLQGIPGLELLSPAESDICCGSAGIYNLVQPEPAAELGRRKARHIAALSPDMIATGNPGCTLQIAAAGRELGYDWPIVHPIELLDDSIRGADPISKAVGSRQ
jgi:glycolate oxidase iron-sulfur subunit